MKINIELTENLIPILSREQLEEALKQSLNFNSPKTLHDSTEVCVPIDSSTSQQIHKEFRNKNVVPDEIINQCAEEYKKGVPLSTICRKFDLKYTTVYGRLDKLGLIIRGKKN